MSVAVYFSPSHVSVTDSPSKLGLTRLPTTAAMMLLYSLCATLGIGAPESTVSASAFDRAVCHVSAVTPNRVASHSAICVAA